MKNFFAIFVLLLSAQSVMITAADQQLIKDFTRSEFEKRCALANMEIKAMRVLVTKIRLEELRIQNPELYVTLPLSKKSRM